MSASKVLLVAFSAAQAAQLVRARPTFEAIVSGVDQNGNEVTRTLQLNDNDLSLIMPDYSEGTNDLDSFTVEFDDNSDRCDSDHLVFSLTYPKVKTNKGSLSFEINSGCVKTEDANHLLSSILKRVNGITVGSVEVRKAEQPSRSATVDVYGNANTNTNQWSNHDSRRRGKNTFSR